jgi:hypothetical protein
MRTLDLFQQIAPSYDANFILAHFAKKFAAVPTEVLTTRIEEFLKFMFLRSTYHQGFIPLTGEVDDIWHEFILQTREYEKLCKALPGGEFIHHNSVHLEDFSKNKDRTDVVRDLINWLPRYYKNFGSFNEEAAQYWMMVSFLRAELKLSLEQINHLAQKAINSNFTTV